VGSQIIADAPKAQVPFDRDCWLQAASLSLSSTLCISTKDAAKRLFDLVAMLCIHNFSKAVMPAELWESGIMALKS
jgi:hypothetical protein